MARDPFDPGAVGAAYDAVAHDYAAAFADDLARLPVDRAVLDDAAARFPAHRPVLDVGCGPGQVGGYLADRGVDVVGVDLASEMLMVAHRRSPALPLMCADMRNLPFRADSLAGVIAYYSVQHVERPELPSVLDEFGRVLASDGVLVIATHLGEGVVVMDEFLGHRIAPAGGTLYERADLEELVTGSGFTIDDVRERGPLENEYPSQRIYITSRLGRRRVP